MNALYDLRDMLCEQLEEYGEKGELSNAVLEKVDVLAHATKNLDKIIEKCAEDEDNEHSGNYGTYGMKSSRRSHGSSRSGMRVTSRRGYAGRYYGDDRDEEENEEFVDQLYSMANEAEDERMRQNLEKLAAKMSHKK